MFDSSRWGYATGTTYSVGDSLRFNDDDSSYLSKALGTPDDADKYTLSMWIKLGNIENMYLFGAGTSTSNNTYIRLASFASQQILWETDISGGDQWWVRTNAVLRDPSAWYHLMFVMDSSLSGIGNQAKIYINGVLASTTTSGTRSNDYINTATTHYIGRAASADYFDGYISEVHFTDGTAYDASAFGEFISGVWTPKSPEVTYGTNGFYLNFADSANIGTDASGQSNDWTPNNFEANDLVSDSPTNNFCTWNPLEERNQQDIVPPDDFTGTLSEGNLRWNSPTCSTRNHSATSTFWVDSGKWYWEGVMTRDSGSQSRFAMGTKYFPSRFDWFYASIASVGTVYGIKVDLDTNSLQYTTDGTNYSDFTAHSSNSSSLGDYPLTAMFVGCDSAAVANFGQDSTFAGAETAGGNTDSNGIGNFHYAPPSGYLALCTANLPEPAISPANDAEPRDYFETFTYTGNGAGLQVGDIIKKPADTIDLTNSLIFNDDDSTYMSRTATAGDRRTWTLSFWMKPSGASTGQVIFGAGPDGSNLTRVDYRADKRFQIFNSASGVANGSLVFSPNNFKDPSVWHHFVFIVDTPAASETDRYQFYVNGVRQTGISSTAGENTYPSQNTQTQVNHTVSHEIGRRIVSNTEYFDGYMAEMHFIDGTAYDASAFGTFDANGIWIPQTPSVTYGTNGFYLDFSDNSTTAALGTDSSGQGNDWTPNNFATTDQVTDSPTDNFATLNPLDWVIRNAAGSVPLSEGNLKFTGSATISVYGTYRATIQPPSGSYYFELTVDDIGTVETQSQFLQVGGASYRGDGTKQGGVAYGDAWADGDVIGCAISESGVWYSRNGTWQNSATVSEIQSGDSTNAARVSPSYPFSIVTGDGSATTNSYLIGTMNFGQKPFAHTPPTGYLTLSENNITVNDQNLEKPDFVWIKQRDVTRNHQLFDSVRGVQKALSSNATDAEADTSNMLLNFNTNGFTVGSDDAVNQDGGTYAAWNWKAGGAAVTNNVGTIESQVSVNTTSGFSVCTFTTPSTGTFNFGHGLDSAPDMVIMKARDSAVFNWVVYHRDLGAGKFLLLNTTAAEGSSTALFGNTDPSDTLIYSASDGGGIGTNSDYVAYAFHSVEGFSKIGSYAGNGSTDGPFVYTGFRPAFVMVKLSSASGERWWMHDTSREEYNGDIAALAADFSGAEETGSVYQLDTLSNGFKLRNSHAVQNSSGATYIYMAFAEMPFKYSRAR